MFLEKQSFFIRTTNKMSKGEETDAGALFVSSCTHAYNTHLLYLYIYIYILMNRCKVIGVVIVVTRYIVINSDYSSCKLFKHTFKVALVICV